MSPCQRVEFTALDGERGHGTLCLPVGHEPGRKAPLVVTVRLGSTNRGAGLTERQVPGGEIDTFGSLGFAYFVAGYLPGNYTGLKQEEGQDILMLPNGVMPALDKLIAMGVADPDRMFLTGGSHNGWSALGLLAQTKRFRAAHVAVPPVGINTLTGVGFRSRGEWRIASPRVPTIT